MRSLRQWLDSNGHKFGCPHFCEAPAADTDTHGTNLFCDCHDWVEPKILTNGRDVAFPAGWTQEQALAWRADQGLATSSPL